MAAEHDESVSEYVEGYNTAGKALDRVPVSGPNGLQDLLRHANSVKTTIDKDLSEEQRKLQKLQNDLNQVNEEYLRKVADLKKLEAGKQVSLNHERKTEIAEVMRTTLDNYLEHRPTSKEEKRSVHVYFLSGEECGSEVHIGREGAGSRDATFIVTLSQTVDSLARQAAKYWGLDPNKVFFLDRDGRIVQGKMCLADIILPPVPQDGNTGPSATGAPAIEGGGTSGSTALAIPGSTKRGAEDRVVGYTVKGRDYSLTLVRAKTVLTKEDLTLPKGEQWMDFTFDERRLQADLDATRKKRGDPDPKNDKVSMEDIPSLWELIKRGQERKGRKQFDKHCRIYELIVFLILVICFIVMLQPEDNWTMQMNHAGREIHRRVTTFSSAERASLGIKNYSEITNRNQYAAWINGPLTRAVYGRDLESKNIYIMAAFGRLFKSPDTVDLNLNWCSQQSYNGTIPNGTNCSNTSGTNYTCPPAPGSCYPDSLKTCPTEDVVELLAYAIDRGLPHIPKCNSPYDKDPIITTVRSLFSVDAFSYCSGEISSYSGGEKFTFNTSSMASWNASLVGFVPDDLADLQPPAKLVILISYLPSLEGIHVTHYLMEFSPTGPLLPTRRNYAIPLDGGDTWEIVLYWICFFLATVILLMELRRITGWPARFFLEDKRDPCGVWTGLFIMLPVLIIISLSVKLKRMGEELNITKFGDNTVITDTANTKEGRIPKFLAKTEPYEWTVAEKNLYELQNLLWLDGLEIFTNLFCFTIMMLLLVRYMLMYFPDMHATTIMVQKVVKPLAVCFLFLGVAFAGFGAMFYIVLGPNIYQFRNTLATFMSTIQFAHGGILNWTEFYREYAWTWWIMMLGVFIVFTVNLNHFAVAVLVSHKKEAELNLNYSSHPFWQIMHRDNIGSGGELNPALAGFDFTDQNKNNPKKVKELPGQQI